MAQHNQLGEKGENLAVQLLREKGYSILAENWRSGRNELDIIARIGETLVFVEVKTRSTAFFGDPSEAVSVAKQKRIVQAANDYMQQYEIELEARFDVISVITTTAEQILDHMEDAFYPMA